VHLTEHVGIDARVRVDDDRVERAAEELARAGPRRANPQDLVTRQRRDDGLGLCAGLFGRPAQDDALPQPPQVQRPDVVSQMLPGAMVGQIDEPTIDEQRGEHDSVVFQLQT